MAIENPVHTNEYGLPLNAISWLETHHKSKLAERARMIRDLHLKYSSKIVDAGCGPGLWTPLLARAVGPHGQILGVDVSSEALAIARARSQGSWFEPQVLYQQGSIEYLPVAEGSIDAIFSANVCQYLPHPTETFTLLGRYLTPGGHLVVKDIDFGTLRFHALDPSLQARVFLAREEWERQRIILGHTFEDSWVGSRLADYVRAAGYVQVQEKSYTITRRAPLTPEFRAYLQGIGEWFVCEDAPFLARDDLRCWLDCFTNGPTCTLDQEYFHYEETEFLVTGLWPGTPLRFTDTQLAACEP
jgi:ubiquinone/menaquinone biosynthesis C-methylase UbiE